MDVGRGVHRQMRQRGCRHAKVPGTSVWDLQEVYVYQAAIASMCSRRVTHQDVEVVKQNVLTTRTQRVVSQRLEKSLLRCHAHVSHVLLGGGRGTGGHTFPIVMQ